MIRNNEGILAFNIADEGDVRDVLGETLRTTTGREFLKLYFTPDREEEYADKWLTAIQRFAKNPAEVTVEEAMRVLRTLMDAGEFVPKVLPPELPVEVPPEPVDDRPRDKNGKLLSQSQIEFGEMRRFLAENDMETVNRRRREDAKFAAFCRHNLKEEMQQGVGDAVTPVGEPEKRTRAGVALATFAREYQKASIASLKPVQGIVHLGDEAVPVDVFNSLLVRARQAGLI